MTELPDDIRVPLHELQADVDYLFGRVATDSSCAGSMASSVKTKLTQLENAIGAILLPTLDAAEGADSAALLRSWAKAYRDTPEHRFPSDPNAEFFPVDLERAADLLFAPPKPAPDAMRSLIALVLPVLDAAAAGKSVQLAAADVARELRSFSSTPVPQADGAMNEALARQYGIPDELWKGATKDNPMVPSSPAEAIIDIAADGTLAGVELIDDMPPPPSPRGGE